MKSEIKKLGIFLAVSAVMLSSAACSQKDEPAENRVMRISLEVLDSASEGTRSSLPELEAFENRINNVSLAVYDRETGRLEKVKFFKGRINSLTLNTFKAYNIYFVANMGDRTDDFPVEEGDMRSFRYVIPSFVEMKASGLPMAMMVASSWKSVVSVKLRRLVAKARITIDSSDMNFGGDGESFSRRRVEVHRAAKGLYPFSTGGSAARNTDDIFTETADFQDAGDGTYDIVVYIPENMQGDLLSGNTDPFKKSESSACFDSSLCTYISFAGSKNGDVDGVDGQYLYRFFVGKDNCENFDVEGNRTYYITLVLTWDGLFMTDEWKVERNSWRDNRRILVSLSPDEGYRPEISGYSMAVGSTDIPVYVHYSPHGEDYMPEDSGKPTHSTSGWMFSPLEEGNTLGYDEVFSDETLETGFDEDQTYRTRHFVSIPKDAAAGSEYRIIYHTNDRRKEARFQFNATRPTIVLDPETIYCSHNEYGNGFIKQISLAGTSTVQRTNIAVTGSEGIKVYRYDSEKGIAHVYWDNINNTDSRKTAEVTFSGCGVSARCRIYQNPPPEFEVAEPENGGGGRIDY